MDISRRLVLHFPATMVDQPILSNLIRQYELSFNILKASITPREQGVMILELRGEEEKYQRAAEYLTSLGVRVQALVQDISRDENRCVHCGACLVICPSDALSAQRPSMEVTFEPDRCIACGACVPVCPTDAMEMQL